MSGIEAGYRSRPLTLLVTGAGGQLGSDLLRVLSGVDGVRAVGVTRRDLDLTDSAAVGAALAGVRPDLVLNAAAYTAVDAAESDEDTAALVNATAPRLLARACARSGAGLVHVSTDYVFAGDASTPYEVDSPTGPKSAYGRTKLAGEQAVRAELPAASWVVRTAWLYGETGRNFVKTIVRLQQSHETLDVVDDQRGTPTWSRDLARGLVELARAVGGPGGGGPGGGGPGDGGPGGGGLGGGGPGEGGPGGGGLGDGGPGGGGPPPGVYHCTNAGDTTWYGLARAVFAELGADPDRVRPTSTDRFPRPAPRPAYSVLSDTAWRSAGLPPLPHWRDALHTAFSSVPFGRP
jgi:dTDP-4-dehydrorhamnose reductase